MSFKQLFKIELCHEDLADFDNYSAKITEAPSINDKERMINHSNF